MTAFASSEGDHDMAICTDCSRQPHTQWKGTLLSLDGMHKQPKVPLLYCLVLGMTFSHLSADVLNDRVAISECHQGIIGSLCGLHNKLASIPDWGAQAEGQHTHDLHEGGGGGRRGG